MKEQTLCDPYVNLCVHSGKNLNLKERKGLRKERNENVKRNQVNLVVKDLNLNFHISRR